MKMTTRREFTGEVLAAGILANFALIAGTHGEGSGNNGNPCNGHGKADECHGNGAKKDQEESDGCLSSSRMSKDQTPPPACRSAGGSEDHVE
jgi:hypothetical protein